jgi:hypothetical protein
MKTRILSTIRKQSFLNQSLAYAHVAAERYSMEKTTIKKMEPKNKLIFLYRLTEIRGRKSMQNFSID